MAFANLIKTINIQASFFSDEMLLLFFANTKKKFMCFSIRQA